MRLFAGTEFDRPPKCDRCGLLEEECKCPPPPPPEPVWSDPATQTARIRIEKRKQGKVVTVITGLAPTETDLPSLLTRLKNECGAGGTVNDDGIEIQGDHASRIATSLAGIGFRIAK